MADQREPRRGPVDPLLAVAAEAAAAGIRGADYVIEGLNESLRAGVATRSTRAAAGRRRAARAGEARARAAGTGPPAAEAPDDVASRTSVDLFVELLGRFGDEIRDLAEGVGGAGERQPECPTLELEGKPGKRAAVEFTFTNTGPTVLADVTFAATDLLGAATEIGGDAVTFDYGAEDRTAIERVGPGRAETVIVAVEIPGDALEGTYHGCIAARAKPPEGRSEVEAAPEDAWTVIELAVGTPVRKKAIEPAKPRKKA